MDLKRLASKFVAECLVWKSCSAEGKDVLNFKILPAFRTRSSGAEPITQGRAEAAGQAEAPFDLALHESCLELCRIGDNLRGSSKKLCDLADNLSAASQLEKAFPERAKALALSASIVARAYSDQAAVDSQVAESVGATSRNLAEAVRHTCMWTLEPELDDLVRLHLESIVATVAA